jgi:hypothetical protein
MNEDNGYIVVISLLAVALLFAAIIACASNGPKFCPECGERYSNNVQYCQNDGCELLERRK